METNKAEEGTRVEDENNEEAQSQMPTRIE
jgi:hypothetical protein